jgi:hypothetical protein
MINARQCSGDVHEGDAIRMVPVQVVRDFASLVEYLIRWNADWFQVTVVEVAH